ncbi:MAG: GTP 3',8-cyclase MoaA [Oligoflexia bacterium]|nr:GTP 3',8-cyclase MoaA [Oligoflexia bacterium]
MLVDNYSRKFKYLRLSLTEKCNFKCSYCLPNGYKGCSAKYLDLNEITNLAFAFKELGIEKIRLTGGEPTLRPDLIKIIQTLKEVVGINHLALTTNGFRLKQDLEKLKCAGLDSLNVSLDSMQESKFKEICGTEKSRDIRYSIDHALRLGFKNVKLNCVLLRDLNDNEFFDFLEFAKSRPVSIRFIELMKTGDNKSYYERHYLPVTSFEQKLRESGWEQLASTSVSGPAKEFYHSNFAGRIGFISPYSKDFCTTCNRLRVSSVGGLRLCLFGQGDISLRDLLQSSDDRKRLKVMIATALKLKPQSHRLNEGLFGDMCSLSAIGG